MYFYFLESRKVLYFWQHCLYQPTSYEGWKNNSEWAQEEKQRCRVYRTWMPWLVIPVTNRNDTSPLPLPSQALTSRIIGLYFY